MGRLTFANESVFCLKTEVMPLLLDHWRELGQRDLTFDPDWHRMGLAERAGQFVVYTARNGVRKLLGYAAFAVHQHLHYRGTTVAYNDVVWLHPDSRRGLAGVRLLRHCEAALKDKGVEKIYYQTKKETNLDALLGWIGYTKTGSVYARGLE